MGGRSGVGRRTAVSLVAFMHQITLYTPNVSRNFGVKQFKNDLKNVSVKELHAFKLYVSMWLSTKQHGDQFLIHLIYNYFMIKYIEKSPLICDDYYFTI